MSATFVSLGWGEPYPPQKEPSSWRDPSAAPPVTVDNGTSAWGKPKDSNYSWDDGRDRESGSGWGNQHKSGMCTQEVFKVKAMNLRRIFPYSKLAFGNLVFTSLPPFMIAPGPKHMDTWCGEEVGNSWDQEEEVEIGMWSNSQQDSRPHDQNTWNYKHKSSTKVCFSFSHICPPETRHFSEVQFLKSSPNVTPLSPLFQMNKPVNKQDDPWMKPFINQFNSMNFSVNIINYSVKYSLCLCPSSTHGAIDNFF